MSVDLLEKQHNTSLFNTNDISDAQLAEEIRKYIRRNPPMSSRLMSVDMGHSLTYISQILYYIKEGKSLQEKTRENFISYLIKKGHFSPMGLPKDLSIMSFKKPKEEEKEAKETPVEAAIEQEKSLSDLSDYELKLELKEYKNSIGSARLLSAEIRMEYSYLTKLLATNLKRSLFPSTRQRIIDFLNSKNWKIKEIGGTTENNNNKSTSDVDYASLSNKELKLAVKECRNRLNLSNTEVAEILGFKGPDSVNSFFVKVNNGIEKRIRKNAIKFLQEMNKPKAPPSTEVKDLLSEKIQSSIETIKEQRTQTTSVSFLDKALAKGAIANLAISDERKETILAFLEANHF